MTSEQERIIAAYIEGTISAEGKAQLEREMQSDKELKALVEELRLGFEIEDYLNGDLSEAEATNFETRMAEDESLKQAVAEFKASEQVLAADQLEGDIKLIKEIAAGSEKTKKPESSSGKSWWIGIIALLGIATGTWWTVGTRPAATTDVSAPNTISPREEEIPVSPEPSPPTDSAKEPIIDPEPDNPNPPDTVSGRVFALLEQYRQVPMNLDKEVIMGGNDLKAIYSQAIDAYKTDQDFEQVTKLLAPVKESIIQEVDDSETALQMLVLLSAAYIHEAQYAAALEILQDTRVNFEITGFKEEATWYTVLAQASLGDYQQAGLLIERSGIKADPVYGDLIQRLESLLLLLE